MGSGYDDEDYSWRPALAAMLAATPIRVWLTESLREVCCSLAVMKQKALVNKALKVKI